MKLSNKILIGFFTFIFLYMSAAFTELRLKGENVNLDDENVVSEELPLDEISHIVISGLHRQITISTSDYPRLEIKSRDGDLLSYLQYEIVNERMSIIGLDADHEIRYRITLFVPRTDSARLDLIESSTLISNFEAPFLDISQDGGRIRMDKNIRIDNLRVNAENDALLSGFDVSINTLSLRLDSSYVSIRSYIQRLEGSMVNDSRLLLFGPGDIEFKKDDSSTMNWNK